MTAPLVENRAPTVLLAEDDEDLRFAIGEVLHAEGYHTVLASSGSSALEQARSMRPDAAVVDLNLPDMTGSNLAEELVRALPDLRVVVISGEQGARAPKGTSLLAKPFAVESLLDALAREVKRPR